MLELLNGMRHVKVEVDGMLSVLQVMDVVLCNAGCAAEHDTRWRWLCVEGM